MEPGESARARESKPSATVRGTLTGVNAKSFEKLRTLLQEDDSGTLSWILSRLLQVDAAYLAETFEIGYRELQKGTLHRFPE